MYATVAGSIVMYIRLSTMHPGDLQGNLDASSMIGTPHLCSFDRRGPTCGRGLTHLCKGLANLDSPVFIHSFIHSFIRSFIHSFIHSFIQEPQAHLTDPRERMRRPNHVCFMARSPRGPSFPPHRSSWPLREYWRLVSFWSATSGHAAAEPKPRTNAAHRSPAGTC